MVLAFSDERDLINPPNAGQICRRRELLLNGMIDHLPSI
jgi:hypothetical protein